MALTTQDTINKIANSDPKMIKFFTYGIDNDGKQWHTFSDSLGRSDAIDWIKKFSCEDSTNKMVNETK